MEGAFQKVKNIAFQNLVNAITAIGIILTVWLNSLLWNNPAEHYLLIFSLAVMVALSDLDGSLARRWQTVTSLGGFLDKFRDKFFACSVFIYFLSQLWYLPNDILSNFVKGLIIFILIIEVFLIAIWFYGLVKRLNVSPHLAGKIKTNLYFIAIGWWFCFHWLGSLFQRGFEIELHLGTVLLLSIASVCGILSITSYLQRYNKKRG